MNSSYRMFFELQREPFTADIAHKEILVTPAIKGVEERIRYAVRLGAVALITGEIGSGKKDEEGDTGVCVEFLSGWVMSNSSEGRCFAVHQCQLAPVFSAASSRPISRAF